MKKAIPIILVIIILLLGSYVLKLHFENLEYKEKTLEIGLIQQSIYENYISFDQKIVPKLTREEISTELLCVEKLLTITGLIQLSNDSYKVYVIDFKMNLQHTRERLEKIYKKLLNNTKLSIADLNSFYKMYHDMFIIYARIKNASLKNDLNVNVGFYYKSLKNEFMIFQ